MRTNLCTIYREGPAVKVEKREPIDTLSPREKELLDLLVRGTPNKEIAKTFNISENTVRNHIANIFSKLKVNNRTEAAFLWHVKNNASKNPQGKYGQHTWLEESHPLESKYGKIK